MLHKVFQNCFEKIRGIITPINIKNIYYGNLSRITLRVAESDQGVKDIEFKAFYLQNIRCFVIKIICYKNFVLQDPHL